MKIKAAIVITIVLAGFWFIGNIARVGPVTVILDTDLSSDVDDVGAVAVLHALANEGSAKILAMMVSSGDAWSAPCLRAINTFMGRPDVPVGQVTDSTVNDVSKYTQIIAEEFTRAESKNDTVDDAVILYRKLLASQPDSSVTIVSIGYLTNLHNLLISKPDAYSELGGTELIRKKVSILVTMGGQYPQGREWNFYQDSASTLNVVENWPTPIRFCGFEIGADILTGREMVNTASPNPLRRSYELYNGSTDRPSWDQVTVLFAVKGHQNYFNYSLPYHLVHGVNRISRDGTNRWEENSERKHAYFKVKDQKTDLRTQINNLMKQAIRDSGSQRTGSRS